MACKPTPKSVFLTEPQLEERWGTKKRYAADLRARGEGPEYVRLSQRIIRYWLDVIEAFEAKNSFTSAAAEAAAAQED